jgi:hypothetical protein
MVNGGGTGPAEEFAKEVAEFGEAHGDGAVPLLKAVRTDRQLGNGAFRVDG